MRSSEGVLSGSSAVSSTGPTYDLAVPYKLQGNSVVRSDTGQVVKSHPSREKALRHLRALKANVEEGSPAVLGSLLEGFDEVRHPRDFRGRFKAGDHVILQHGMFGQVPAQVTKVTASRVHVTSADPRVSDTSMTHNQAAVKLERKPSMADRRREQARIETERRRSVDPNAPAAEVYKPPTEAAVRQLARDGVYFGATDLGREGRAARERGASSQTTEHADTRDKLTNLPVGQRYGLHGPQGQVGHVERTANGWEVVGSSKPATSHKTPSSAAGAAMRIQRTAASSREQANVMMRNYRGRGEVERMNARQSQRAEAEAERQLEIRVRTASSARDRALAQTELERRRGGRTSRPRIRESAPAVLGALLEGC